MKPLRAKLSFGNVRNLLALICSLLMVVGDPAIYALPSTQQAAPPEEAAPEDS